MHWATFHATFLYPQDLFKPRVIQAQLEVHTKLCGLIGQIEPSMLAVQVPWQLDHGTKALN